MSARIQQVLNAMMIQVLLHSLGGTSQHSVDENDRFNDDDVIDRRVSIW